MIEYNIINRTPAPLHTSVCDVAQWGMFFWRNRMCNEEKKIEVKQPTTYDEQVKKIIEHGCIVGDEGYAKL